MKHVNKFNEFMSNTVNLNQTRLDTLTSRVDAIDKFLKSDDLFGELYSSIESQGSYAHKTIIKPSEKKAVFDADVVFYLKENDDWEPKDYVEELYKRFKGNGTYKDKCGRGTRCVTIDYVGEFHLDIVPCIKRDSFFDGETFHICNRNENSEEKTDPQGYTDWLKGKNNEVGNNNLIKTIRLFKYLRDIKQTFSCKSILLSTLVANRVGGIADLFDDYVDLPTSLKILINNLNSYLQSNMNMPIVSNPVNDEEDFNRHWTQEKYTNFRTQIQRYNSWINDAFDEEDQAESVKKWQKIFDSEFGKSFIKKPASSKLAASNFPVPAHALPPRWPIFNYAPVDLKVIVHRPGNINDVIAELDRKIGPKIPKGLAVRMEYRGQMSSNQEIHWQIVNSGKEAAGVQGGLRGGFYKDTNVRNETTQYTGVHYIECFIVDKKKKICIFRSGRYFINIE